MAKNRTMEQKHAKARKCAIQEAQNNAKHEMCAIHIITQASSVLWNIGYKPYSITR